MIYFALGVIAGVFLPVRYNLAIKDLIATVWSKMFPGSDVL